MKRERLVEILNEVYNIDGDAKFIAADLIIDEIESARPSLTNPVRAALEGLVKSLDDLIADSDGVAGLHRNGDVATWDELTSGGRFENWLSSLDAARAALSVNSEAEREGWKPIARAEELEAIISNNLKSKD